jgi:hypothetical protein
MSYIRGEDRGQMALLPAAIEDYVAEDAPVRVIDAFVDGLDVRGLGFGRSEPAFGIRRYSLIFLKLAFVSQSRTPTKFPIHLFCCCRRIAQGASRM